VQTSTSNLWHNYFYLRGVRAENRQLKAQIEHMRLEQVRLSEDAEQAHRLQMLLAFKEQFISKTVAAQVIGTSGSDLSRVIYIDKGKNDGIDRDMAVITADGIVGKVLLVYPSLAQVLLISDQSSGVGAILEKSRLQGVLRGSPNGEIVLERVMSDEMVQPGEPVLTSGGDQIFPKGLPVGTVTKVGNGKDLFLDIKIRPAVHLANLEEVLVLAEKQERQVVAEDHGRGRTADILAQRLPSVPDKPATEATASGAAQPGASSPAAQNNATKPKGTAASIPSAAGKTAAGTNPPQPAPGQPAKIASQSPAAQNAKPVNNPPPQGKSSAVQTQTSTPPPIVEPKPAPVATPPASAPPPPNNSPQ
jgi:rod shape-determining protein MreC